MSGNGKVIVQEKTISDNRTQMNADKQDFNKIVFCVNPRPK